MSDELTLELERIDNRIAELNDAIKRGDALERLMKNEDFKLVILDGYLDEEATRIFDNLVRVPAIRKESNDIMMDKLNSIRHMKEYIGTPTYPGTVLSAAMHAPEQIEAEQDYRLEVTSNASEAEE
jgi:glutaredoxin 2